METNKRQAGIPKLPGSAGFCHPGLEPGSSRIPSRLNGEGHIPYYSLALISCAMLAYEILLMRFFSIIHWHHFAYMVISFVLLGLAVSGTVISIFHKSIVSNYEKYYIFNCAVFAFTLIGCFYLAEVIPFNTLEVLWDPKQWRYLLAIYLILMMPFFIVGNCICMTLYQFGQHIPTIYAANLIGAAAGGVLCIIGLFYFHPTTVLFIISGIVILAVFIASKELQTHSKRLILFLVLALSIGIYLHHNGYLPLHMTAYKGLQQQLHVPGSHIVKEVSSPLGVVTIVDSPTIPFRAIPGLSLANTFKPPKQLGLYVDGMGPRMINEYHGSKSSLAIFAGLTSSIGYELRNNANVLILGNAGSTEILQAVLYNATAIDVTERNQDVTDIITKEFAEFTGWEYLQPTTRIFTGNQRAILQANDKLYDLIQLPISIAPINPGPHGFSENYLYTEEAFNLMWQKLTHDGVIVINQWLTLPPKGTLKIISTLNKVLLDLDVEQPRQHIAIIRGWRSVTILLKKSPFTAHEVDIIKQFSADKAFDPVYYDGIQSYEVNKINKLYTPAFYLAASALLGKTSSQFIDNYKFNISPTRDDRPFFNHYVKWDSIRELFTLKGQGGLAMIDLSYPVLIIILAQAFIVSIVLILLPLNFQKGGNFKPMRAWREIFYFTNIGLAFLFIEIAMIHQFALYLGDPIYSAATIITGFLLFAGIGSYVVQSLITKRQRLLLYAILGIIVFSILVYVGEAILMAHTLDYHLAYKMLLTLVIIAPLAFCMGMPFPIGLLELSKSSRHLVPWAWGVNGCASVISTLLATLLALHFGFTMLVGLALCLYGLTCIGLTQNSVIARSDPDPERSEGEGE